MAKKSTASNGHERLEEAMALLIQNQAAFVQNQGVFVQNEAALLGRIADLERVTSERFARIEADMGAILRVLAEHSRMLERLPEAVRDKIGFKAAQQ